MKIKHEEWIKNSFGQYYIDTFFAIVPTLLNTGGAMPGFVWLKCYWQTYPVDADGKVIEMYRITYTKDPRSKK